MTLTAVHPLESYGDLRVDAFSVRPNPMPHAPGLGEQRGRLDSIDGFQPERTQVVDSACPSPITDVAGWTGGYELGVQVTRTSGDVAGARAFEVVYSVGDRQASLTVPFGVMLCAAECPEIRLWTEPPR